MEQRKSEAGEQRQVLVCVGERADELQALFNWASSCFFEPRDVVSIMYARFDTAQLMVRRDRACQTHSQLASPASTLD
jgi:hypothetical protein